MDTTEMPATLGLWQVLSWIAWREITPRRNFLDEADFATIWGVWRRPEAVLRALDARAADAPYCLWEPPADGDADCSDGFGDLFASPRGPSMLRRTLGLLRRKQGHVVSFGGAADLLRRQLTDRQTKQDEVDTAWRELKDALATDRLPMLGRPSPGAPFERVAGMFFLEHVVPSGEDVTIDPQMRAARDAYRGPTPILSYFDSMFYSRDVARLWPPKHFDEADTVLETEELKDASDRTGAQGRPTSRHLVKTEFERRVEAGTFEDSLTGEAKVLSAWLQDTHPRLAQMTPGTVKNCIREPYRLAKATK